MLFRHSFFIWVNNNFGGRKRCGRLRNCQELHSRRLSRPPFYGACLGLDRLSEYGIIGNCERRLPLNPPKKLYTLLFLEHQHRIAFVIRLDDFGVSVRIAEYLVRKPVPEQSDELGKRTAEHLLADRG